MHTLVTMEAESVGDELEYTSAMEADLVIVPM